MAAHVSYTPTFHHTNWVDKIDRVEADGPNGFNTRFNAIGADLRQLSTVVTQIDAALEDFQAPPDPPPQLMSFTPVFGSVPSEGSPWTTLPDGTAIADTLGNAATLSFFGLMNLTLPSGVRLNTMRVLGNLIPDDTLQASGTVTLWRTLIRLTAGPAAVDMIVKADTGSGFLNFDILSQATGQATLIDPSTYRYFVTGTFQTPADIFPSTSMTVETIQLAFLPA